MKKFTSLLSVTAFLVAVVGLAACNTDSVALNSMPTVYAQTDTFTYQDFDQETYDTLRGSQPFSIFFHSKTCGTCAKKNAEIMSEKHEFSNGTILKLEYSEAPQELLAELGVTKYDTFVNFAADGTAETVMGAAIDDVRAAIK